MTSLIRLAQRGHRALPRPAPRNVAMAVALGLVAIVVPMFTIDVPSIVAARGLSPGVVALFRFITDFANTAWFLWPLGTLIVAVAIWAWLKPTGRVKAEAWLAKLTFLFAAVALTRMAAYYVKYLFGRARPFVGGEPNAFLYDPFNPLPAYASMPSGHATTAFAVLFAFGALWPRLRPVLWIYALVMGLARVVVIAHHPSDVIAGALFGAFGAWLIRRYFAARDLAFDMKGGAIVAKA